MITLMMAGWRLCLICQPDALTAYTAAHYAPFVTDDAPPHFTATLALNVADAATPIAPDNSDELEWHLDGELCRLEAADFGGHIVPRDRSAAFTFRAPGALGNLGLVLKTIFAVIADLNGGLLLHASGLLVDGQVYLFMGHGGSGKSTVVRLSPHTLALNDDTVLVHQAGGEWAVSGTPFWNHRQLRGAGKRPAAL